MKQYFSQILIYFKSKITHPYLLFVALVSFLLCWLFSFFHYKEIYYGNPLSWITWVIGIFSFSYSFMPVKLSFSIIKRSIRKSDLLLCGFIIALFFVSHLVNFSTAPWNSNGLFDDAAWDIYFAKNHVFNDTPFQPAFFDSVGYASREVVFHYYISIFFKLFGYNLLVFNVSLLILGFVTVFFATFLIHRMFDNVFVTVLSAIIINFFPLHFMHIFMGHRYTIAAPLMTVSLYYLYSAFSKNSLFRSIISAIFAALCFDSAIMGKQYLYGLIISAFLILISIKNQEKSKEKISTGIVWFVGFLISATPLLVYIICNYSAYTLREGSLIKEFIAQYKSGGFYALKPYLVQLRELFFAKHSYLRQFVPGFYAIPLSYYFLIIPGLLLALLKRRFEIIFLSLIPIAGAFVSGSFDFRVLIAVPIWVISMAFGLNNLFLYRKPYRYIAILLGLTCLAFGLFPSIKYIWRVSRDPNYLYLLPHKDVAVSRLVQDIVIGADNPTSKMKWNELNRGPDISLISHDTLVCPFSAYAIMHLYLQNYNDKKILSFIDQGIQLLKTPAEILSNNTSAIISYTPTNKDLKLVWEVSDKTNEIIKMFSYYDRYGSEETFSGVVDGNQYSIYVLTIKSKFMEQFKRDIAKRFYQQLPTSYQ